MHDRAPGFRTCLSDMHNELRWTSWESLQNRICAFPQDSGSTSIFPRGVRAASVGGMLWFSSNPEARPGKGYTNTASKRFSNIWWDHGISAYAAIIGPPTSGSTSGGAVPMNFARQQFRVSMIHLQGDRSCLHRDHDTECNFGGMTVATEH